MQFEARQQQIRQIHSVLDALFPAPFLYRMIRRIKAFCNHDPLCVLQIPHLELRLAGFMPRGRGRMGRQRDVYFGRLALIARYGVTQTEGPGAGSARVPTAPGPARAKRCEAVDASEDGADLFGAEEAILDRQAGGAETETGLEQGEVGGQGGNVCEGGSVRGEGKGVERSLGLYIRSRHPGRIGLRQGQ